MIENIKDSQFKINVKDLLRITENVSVCRKCKGCGKMVPVIAALPGQHIICPECGKEHAVKYEVSFKAILEEVEV